MTKKDTGTLVIRQSTPAIVPYNDMGEPIKKPNCKLCQAKFRTEVEEKFEELKNYKALVNWLKKEKEMDISYPAVRNHIIHHYKLTERYEFLKEFAEDVEKWVSHKDNKAQTLRNRIAILDREMCNIAAEGDAMTIDERRKNAETVKRLADTLLAYETKLSEHEKHLLPAQIVLNHLQIIVTDEIKHLTDDGTRKVLTNVLERLNTEVGDIIVDQGD